MCLPYQSTWCSRLFDMIADDSLDRNTTVDHHWASQGFTLSMDNDIFVELGGGQLGREGDAAYLVTEYNGVDRFFVVEYNPGT